MGNELALLCVAAGVSAVICLRAAPIGRWLGVLDHPDNTRKRHKHVTPQIGGVAVLTGLMLWLTAAYAFGLTPDTGLANVVAIAAGGYQCLALKSDGSVVAWGDNSQDQCNVPPGLTNVVAVAGGGGHSLALGADGKVTAWGAVLSGQCDLPPGLPPASGIAAGEYHTVVLLADSLPVPQLLNPAWQSNRFSAQVQTLSPKNYALEYKDSLSATNWTSLSTNAGNGALKVLTNPGTTASQRFYRMRQW